jgi:hypothetical protein
MNARLLLSDLRGAGVNLTPQGDGLHVDAPAGALTGALRGCLVENKEALITTRTGAGRARSGGRAGSRHPLVGVPGLDQAARSPDRGVARGQGRGVLARSRGEREPEAEPERGSEERRCRLKQAAIVN